MTLYVSEAISFVNRHRLSLICLLETKVSVRNESLSQRSFFPAWQYVVVYGMNRVDRMQVCWDPSRVVVDVIDTASQWIHVKTTFLETNISSVVTFVYGLNEVHQRQPLWEFVRLTAREC